MSTGEGRSNDVVLMGHGGGGAMTDSIIGGVILRELGNPILDRLDDGACLTIPESEIVMTTDSFVIDPIFFPGGDIGGLSVCGTVNDLAMQGARPRYLSLALILEEGLAIADLEKIVTSVGAMAKRAGVTVVTGDTKVVERPGQGRRPGLLINTTGIGVRPSGVDVAVSNAKPGDSVIVTGTIGDHGVAVMNVREDLQLQSSLESDAAPLCGMVGALLEAVPGVHCMRDPTRGGLAAALCDIAAKSGCCVRIVENSLPVRREVDGACSILGLDVLNVANEGKAVIICAAEDEAAVLKCIRGDELGRQACVIGNVAEAPAGMVLMETRAGGERMVDVPAGVDLPRIC